MKRMNRRQFFILFLLRESSCLSPPTIVEHPSDVIVARDLPATLRCEAKGDPEPTITWHRIGRAKESLEEQVTTAPQHPTSHRVLLPAGHLFFLRVVQGRRNDDRGSYWCVATNSQGQVISERAILDISVLKNEFAEEPLDTWVINGDNITLPCQPPEGHPVPEIQWMKGEEIIKLASSTSNGRLRLGLDSASLLIVGAQQSDEGQYQCLASNIAGVRHTHEARLDVYVKPFIIKAPENVTSEVGEHVRFSCVVGGDPPPDIEWVKANGEIKEDNTKTEERAILNIRSVSRQDSGKYVCQAENIAGEITSAAFLQIHSPPVFLTVPEDKIVKKGAKVVLDCQVESSPSTILFWLRDGLSTPLLPLARNQQQVSVDKKGSLLVESVSDRELGWYGCFAVSETGSAVAISKLSLKMKSPKPPPIIQLGPVNQTLVEGSKTILHCQFSSKEKGKIQTIWLKEGIPIEISGKDNFYLTDGHNLQIKDIKKQDSGLYTCQIKTQSGQSSASASLTVQTQEQWDSTANNLLPVYDLLAFPASPSKPKLVESSPTSLTISWGKPHRVGNSPLRGYQVDYFTPGEFNHWVTSHIQGEIFTLENITPGTSVVFLVRARNEHGLSPPSPLSETMTTEPTKGSNKEKKKSEMLSQISDKLVELKKVTVVGPDKAKLFWKVLSPFASEIQGYHIHYQEHDPHNKGHRNDLKTITMTKRVTPSTTLNNLKPGTEYRVFIVPYSDLGPTRPSNFKTFITNEAVPDVHPSHLELMLLNSTAAMAKWRHPQGHGKLTGYKIEIFAGEDGQSYPDNSALVKNFTLDTSATSLVLNNLTTGVIYTVRLAVFNRAGIGPFSGPVSLKVEPGLLYQSDAVYPQDGPILNTAPTDQVFQETWFVSAVGLISILLVLILAGFVLARRRHMESKYFGHYNVPICKVDDSSEAKYFESETLWINPKVNNLALGSGHLSSSVKKETSSDPHIYINNMCPPEYAELDGPKVPEKNQDPTHGGPCYASTNIMEQSFHKKSEQSRENQPGREPSLLGGHGVSSGNSDKSSNEEHSSGQQLTGETTSGSGGQSTDTCSSRGRSYERGLQHEVPIGERQSKRNKRSKSSQRSQEVSSNQSDLTNVPQKQLACKSSSKSEYRIPTLNSEFNRKQRNIYEIERHRLGGINNNSSHPHISHVFGSEHDPGLPPVPPARGLSSYKGVRAGSYNSFGNTHHEQHVHSSQLGRFGQEDVGSNYSVPGIMFSMNHPPGCSCCNQTMQNSHYESASIYKDGIYLPFNNPEGTNKMYFNEDGTYVKVNCDMCKSALCICKDPDISSEESSISESVYAASGSENGEQNNFQKSSNQTEATCDNYSKDINNLPASPKWKQKDDNPSYQSFRPKEEGINTSQGNCRPSKIADKAKQMKKKPKRRMSDGGHESANDTSNMSSVTSVDKKPHSQSVNPSPALSRRKRPTHLREASLFEKKNSWSHNKVNSEADTQIVGDDISEMVEQIQAIQNDISELAGRPISLIGTKP